MYVSIIIPTFNRAGFICRAVDSVLKQSFEDLELIVVDDGSRDDTRRIISRYNDKRLVYIYQENRGVSAARNTGLAAAKGRYVALLDSDDFWLIHKLRHQLLFMSRTGFKISQTLEIWTRGGKRFNQGLKHQKSAGWIFEKSLRMCMISPSCVMMEKDLIRQGKYYFDEKLPACEDYELWLRVTLEHPVGLVPLALTVKQGGRSDQLSRKITGLDLWRIYALKKILEQKKLPEDKRAGVLTALREKAGVYISGCLKRGKEEEALRIKELVFQVSAQQTADQIHDKA